MITIRYEFNSASATDLRFRCVVHLRTNLGKSTQLHYITLEKWHVLFFKRNTSQYAVTVRFSCLQSNCTWCDYYYDLHVYHSLWTIKDRMKQKHNDFMFKFKHLFGKKNNVLISTLRTNSSSCRVPTDTGKPGKMRQLFPVREKSGNFEKTLKSQGKVREF